ncbi:MAG TPA: hypothetical protein VLW65_01140 [Bryobacteraceae bacterium]|nr:hypothetical protein [Bryobacteraceae bacterium]
MSPTAKRSLGCALISVFLILCSCSSQPAGPKIGTPAFYWQAAREVYAAGDYNKTLQHLDNVLATDNEYTPRALSWALVLKSGLASGYMEAAENYDLGAHKSRTDPAAFRRLVSDYRQSASRLALQFAEDFGKLDKVSGDTIPIEFTYPKGTAAPVSLFTKVTTGVTLTPAETDTALQRALERGVLLAACRAVGAPNDTAKAEDIFRAGTVLVRRATFLMGMAQQLYDLSQLYITDKLDQPQMLEALCQRAQNALKAIPESKDTKELDGKIQAALKKTKK